MGMRGALSEFFNAAAVKGYQAVEIGFQALDYVGDKVEDGFEAVLDSAPVAYMTDAGEKVLAYAYDSVEPFAKHLENLTGSVLNRFLIDEALKAGRLVAEQSELLHDLVTEAHKNGFDPEDPENQEMVHRIGEIEKELLEIVNENPDIMSDPHLRVFFGAGKSGEFVITTTGGGALFGTGLGSVVGAAGVAYGANLAYEIGYGDKIRELILDKDMRHDSRNDLNTMMQNPGLVEWLDEEATERGVVDGSIALGGSLVGAGAGKLVSMGAERLAGGALTKMAEGAGYVSGQAGYTQAISGEAGLSMAAGGIAAVRLLRIPTSALLSSNAFVARYAPEKQDGPQSVHGNRYAGTEHDPDQDQEVAMTTPAPKI